VNVQIGSHLRLVMYRVRFEFHTSHRIIRWQPDSHDVIIRRFSL